MYGRERPRHWHVHCVHLQEQPTGICQFARSAKHFKTIKIKLLAIRLTKGHASISSLFVPTFSLSQILDKYIQFSNRMTSFDFF